MSLLQQNTRKRISLGQDGNTLVLLIAFNVIVFILLNFVKIVYLVNNSTEGAFEGQVMSFLSVPAQPAVFSTRPWTLLSYMFSNYKLLEIISSMLWLWAFGFIFQDLTGNRKLVPVYIYGGFVGSIVFLLTANLIPSLHHNVNSIYPLVGCGPALMALAVATTTMAPRYKILPMINIPLWVLSAVFVIIMLVTESSSLGHVAALLGGGLMGYVFIWQLEKGNDWGQWMTDAVNWADDLFRPEKRHFKNSPKNQLFYKSNQKPFEKIPFVTQQRVDDLLDKIHHRGYHSLSEEEKEFLKKASREEL